jgi:hypothetical protein
VRSAITKAIVGLSDSTKGKSTINCAITSTTNATMMIPTGTAVEIGIAMIGIAMATDTIIATSEPKDGQNHFRVAFAA